MQKVFVCVRKICFDERTKVLKPVDVSVGTLPRLITKSFPTTYKNQSLLTCQGVWTCQPASELDNKLLISLTCDNKILASVVIPLSWLPQNQVVKTWFPMKLQNHKSWKHAPMALVAFHLDTLGKKRFDAPRGNLNVTPAWKIPQNKNKVKSQIMNKNAQQMQQPIFMPSQQLVQPMYYNQYPQYPPQYIQNPQFVSYQMPQQPQQRYQMPRYNFPHQCAFSNDDIPEVAYPRI